MENPYHQHFCGEAVFRHELPFDRSSLTRWRQRLGEEHLAALLQESLAVAHRTGALATKELERVAVDTTVQPKAIAHPTDARLMHRAGRYTHAHQFKRARRALKFLRIQHSADDPALVEEVRSLVEAIVLTPRAGACGLTSRATSQGSSRSLRSPQSKSPPAIFSRAGSSR